MAVVAFGGGHGLSASLPALRLLVGDLVVDDLTAVVTVADNGGSCGRLRGEFGVLPPGDLRMALAALCGDDEWGDTWSRVLQHRFAGEGEMRGHVVGNLLIVGALGAARRPRRRPSTGSAGCSAPRVGCCRWRSPPWTSPPRCAAWTRDPDRSSTVRGQVEVATTDGDIDSITLDPADAPAAPEALRRSGAADWVVLGPGRGSPR